MAVANTERVQKRVIAILLAFPRSDRYSILVGNNGRYTTQEVYDAILEADAQVCTDIIETEGHPYGVQFIVPSTPLSSGSLIPAHLGNISKVEVAVGTTYSGGLLASSRSEVLEVNAFPSIYGTVNRWYWIENNEIVHTGTNAKVYYPSLTMTSLCQSPEGYEESVIAGAVAALAKDGASSDYYSYYNQQFNMYRQLIRGQAMVLPPAQMFEQAA